MKVTWEISTPDVKNVQSIYESQRNKKFVQDRQRNLNSNKPLVTKDRFWRTLVCMRLTTQQKSGPGSAVDKFTRQEPFPLSLSFMRSENSDLCSATKQRLKSHGLSRFLETISQQCVENFNKLEAGAWKATLDECNKLLGKTNRALEQEVARYIAKTFKGIGSKQARNILQALGLTQFEIPIDSRITAWLNNNLFPSNDRFSFRVSAEALGDPHYYDFVSDGIQLLCEQAGISPREFDAAVFASYDTDDHDLDVVKF